MFYQNVESRKHNSSCTGCETDIADAVELLVNRNGCKALKKRNFLTFLISVTEIRNLIKEAHHL